MFYTRGYSHGHITTGRKAIDFVNHAVVGFVEILRGCRVLRW
jgi:hypothetical protein